MSECPVLLLEMIRNYFTLSILSSSLAVQRMKATNSII